MWQHLMWLRCVVTNKGDNINCCHSWISQEKKKFFVKKVQISWPPASQSDVFLGHSAYLVLGLFSALEDNFSCVLELSLLLLYTCNKWALFCVFPCLFYLFAYWFFFQYLRLPLLYAVQFFFHLNGTKRSSWFVFLAWLSLCYLHGYQTRQDCFTPSVLWDTSVYLCADVDSGFRGSKP